MWGYLYIYCTFIHSTFTIFVIRELCKDVTLSCVLSALWTEAVQCWEQPAEEL